MKCPECNKRTKVMASRGMDEFGMRKRIRKRKCPRCNIAFYTKEIPINWDEGKSEMNFIIYKASEKGVVEK